MLLRSPAETGKGSDPTDEKEKRKKERNQGIGEKGSSSSSSSREYGLPFPVGQTYVNAYQ